MSIATFGRRILSNNPHTKSSINYSREDLDTRMAIGTVDIVGRMRSCIGTSEDTNDRHSLLLHEIELLIRSDMILTIGQYRVKRTIRDPIVTYVCCGVTYLKH